MYSVTGGHKSLTSPRVSQQEESYITHIYIHYCSATANDNAAELSTNNDQNDNDTGIDLDNDDLEAEEMDYGYRSETLEEDEEEEEEEEEEENDLGREDREEPWEMDDVQAEGFDKM